MRTGGKRWWTSREDAVIFDPASLHAAVNKTLKEADVGADQNAFLVVVTTDGVRAVVSTKVGEHWTVKEVVSVSYDKHIEGGIEVMKTW